MGFIFGGGSGGGGGPADTDALPEGSSNLYLTEARVRDAVLTGFAQGAGTVAAADSVLQAFNKLAGNSLRSLRADKITVFPTNDQFSYGVQQFDDLNEAYASMSRGTGTAEQASSNWVVIAPGKTYTPASHLLKVRASGTSGNNYVEDFGYNNQLAVGRAITGTGIPNGTTISSITVVSSKIRATLSANLTQTITNEVLQVDMPMTIYATSTDTSNQLTVASSACPQMVGKTITGANIPVGTTISSISYSSGSSTITMSQNATGTATGYFYVEALADKFYCDLTRKGVLTVFMGPASLGTFPSGSSWAPLAGTDMYHNFEVQLPVMANVASIRAAFHMSMLNPNQVAKDSHDVYRLNMLSGSLKYLDNGASNGSSTTLSSIGNMIIWGDDGGKTTMNGTTTSGSAVISGLATTARFSVGQSVSGTGIPANSYIKSIDSATQFTMTRNATASATVSIAGSSKGIEADVISAGNLFLSLYNTRVRSTCCQAVNRSSYAIYNTVELVYARGCRFERTIAVNRWSNISDSVITQGLLWQNTTQNGENDGIYNCDLQTAGALFEGPVGSRLKLDGASNYHFIVNGCKLSSNTTKLLLERSSPVMLNSFTDRTVGNTVSETTLLPAQLSISGTRTSGSPIITGLSSTALLSVGRPVSGTGIASGSIIQSIDSATQVTLSLNASSNGTSSYTFEAGFINNNSTAAQIPADSLVRGRIVKVKMKGFYSTDAAAPTLEIKFKAGSTVLATTSATTQTASISNRMWSLELLMQVINAGATGRVMCNGSVKMHQAAFAAPFEMGIFNTTPQTLDTTVAQTLDITATWDTANVNNTITCTHVIIEDLSQ